MSNLSGGWCDRCPTIDMDRLYVTVDGKHYCSIHWKGAGRPWPRLALSIQEVHTAEVAARDHMMKRGGTDRHLVLKGLS